MNVRRYPVGAADQISMRIEQPEDALLPPLSYVALIKRLKLIYNALSNLDKIIMKREKYCKSNTKM